MFGVPDPALAPESFRVVDLVPDQGDRADDLDGVEGKPGEGGKRSVMAGEMDRHKEASEATYVSQQGEGGTTTGLVTGNETSLDPSTTAHPHLTAFLHPASSTPTPRPKLDGGRSSTQRFQSAARRAINARRVVNYSRMEERREPGIDPNRVELPDLRQKVVVQTVDYSKTMAEFNVLENNDLEAFLDKPRPQWASRWIHVNGLSWDVIKLLALKYNLHPLSLEDILHHGTSSTRSKADYYKDSLFVSVVVHKTFASDGEDDLSAGASYPGSRVPSRAPSPAPSSTYGATEDEESRLPRSRTSSSTYPSPSSTLTPAGRAPPSSHEAYTTKLIETFRKIGEENSETMSGGGGGVVDEDERVLTTSSSGLGRKVQKLSEKVPSSVTGSRADRMAARHTVTALTKDLRVHIHVEQLSIFVLRDGTIISFTQDSGYHKRFSTIFDRIASPGDLIRDSEDVSFILQALLDVVADHALEIVDEFRDQITRLESRVLTSPDMGDVRHLHILSAQLLLLKSTLSPLQHLLQGIRLQDDAKAAAACKDPDETLGSQRNKSLGFVSFEAKIYLGDVMDHVESSLSSLDLFASLAENLIAFTFNQLSYSSNSYMQALSVLSVIFLPLTFLSGYFGMNFGTFPHVLEGSVSYFWKIAIPTALGTMLIFSWKYLVDMVMTARRQSLRLYHRATYKKKYE